MDNNTIVIILLAIMAVISVSACICVYLRDSSLDDIRADVYQLFLKAEHKYLETGAGQKKMRYVIGQTRELLPAWAQIFITDTMLESVVQKWFDAVKDLLDDGKLNRSAGEDTADGK